MNIERLRIIQRHILEEPQRVNMEGWVIKQSENPVPYARLARRGQDPACGTVACIAGWAVELFNEGYSFIWYSTRARTLLDLTCKEVNALFYTEGWPYEFKERLFAHKPGTRGYAQIVSDYIDYTIKLKIGFEKGEV